MNVSPFIQLDILQDLRGAKLKRTYLEELGAESITLMLLIRGLDKNRLYGIKDLPGIPVGEYDSLDDTEVAANLLTILDSASNCELDARDVKFRLRAWEATASDRARVWANKILKHNMQVGIQPKVLNKIYPGSIYVFETKLCATYKFDKPLKGKWAVEPKLDGMRCYIEIFSDSSYKTYSRGGKGVPGANSAADELLGVVAPMLNEGESWVFDGEMLDSNRQLSIGNARASGRDTETLKFHVWDVFSGEKWQDFGVGGGCLGTTVCICLDYIDRRNFLGMVMSSIDNWSYVEKTPTLATLLNPTPEQLREAMRDAIAQGHEGTIVKKVDSLYTLDRSKDWYKCKVFKDAEFPLVDIQPGKEGSRLKNTCGYIVIEVKKMPVRCGSGMSDKDREDIWYQRAALLARVAAGDPPLVKIGFQGYTPKGSLDFPIFLGVALEGRSLG